MIHADKVRDAERAVVEAAVRMHAADMAWDGFPNTSEAGEWFAAEESLSAAIVALLALRATTCQTCGGTGTVLGAFRPVEHYCPAGCDEGRRR